jgi:hypothetical protein
MPTTFSMVRGVEFSRRETIRKIDSLAQVSHVIEMSEGARSPPPDCPVCVRIMGAGVSLQGDEARCGDIPPF